ncbi:late embryogenesis abundant protein 6-like [Punica granatum]|uniref:Late embryogenesis abundant protein 6-like n=1 Tax=Punica granatum TaxID=22663 RepID=A0A6P8DQH2_PUNGR|nr:late embryogenesis abundant protein 6-like [Punica granatum]
MQAIKDKINDMTSMRKAKSDARAEEKAEKDLAKARMGIAHEVRLAKEAEAAMDLHVAKADELAKREMEKQSAYADPHHENAVDLNEHPHSQRN